MAKDFKNHWTTLTEEEWLAFEQILGSFPEDDGITAQPFSKAVDSALEQYAEWLANYGELEDAVADLPATITGYQGNISYALATFKGYMNQS
jgi:hypothetical protein